MLAVCAVVISSVVPSRADATFTPSVFVRLLQARTDAVVLQVSETPTGALHDPCPAVAGADLRFFYTDAASETWRSILMSALLSGRQVDIDWVERDGVCRVNIIEIN